MGTYPAPNKFPKGVGLLWCTTRTVTRARGSTPVVERGGLPQACYRRRYGLPTGASKTWPALSRSIGSPPNFYFSKSPVSKPAPGRISLNTVSLDTLPDVVDR